MAITLSILNGFSKIFHCFLLTEIKAKQKDEDRVVEAKEAFSSLDVNQDNV